MELRKDELIEGCKLNQSWFPYEISDVINYGTFGNIFKATYLLHFMREKCDSFTVAIKKINVANIGRCDELMMLTKLQHVNIVELIDAYECNINSTCCVYLVQDYSRFDLEELIADPPNRFGEFMVNGIMRQLLCGLQYIHSKNIVHRDLTPKHILIGADFSLRITGFGSAISLDSQSMYPSRVGTLIYEAPELLLGSKNYGLSIDMWSAGCIMAEMYLEMPILPGTSTLNQLNRIINLLGTLSPDVWPGVTSLEGYHTLPYTKTTNKHMAHYWFTLFVLKDTAIDLIEKLLVLDPEQRLTAEDAQNHDFFNYLKKK